MNIGTGERTSIRSGLWRGRLLRWLVAFGLVTAGWVTPGLNQVAWAQTATTCFAAGSKGADGPIDYGAYCWIDFTPLDLTQAKSAAGQPFRVNLRGGAYLTFTLRITNQSPAGDNMYAVAVPSWSGAAFGNSAFNGIPGRPILYQDPANQNGPENTVTLSNLTLHANGATELPFVFVAADGESSNTGETLSFTTTGDPWALVSAPGQSNPSRNMPVLAPPTAVGNSTGSQLVTITGTAAGSAGEGSYVFTTNNSPGTVTTVLKGAGLQGALFGLKYHTIGLSLTKTHVGTFTAGGTGSYTINTANTVIYPEINPPTEPQPVRVVDTLPVGLTFASASGTGWTCTNAGQVVTCDTTALQDLTTSKTFPPITIGVNVASDAPATLVNVAEISDPTTSTLVFNVCETAANGVCPNSATNTTGDTTTVVRPNLTVGSTKSVVDVNGGDAEAGDILRYTITLAETGGVAASNVTVSDPVPTGLLAPTGLDPASTCSGSASVSGGTLTVTGINLAANGSCTLVFDMAISGSAFPGQDIVNVATITVPNGTGGDVQSAALTVFDPGALIPGTKNLYLRNDGTFATKLSRERPNANGTVVTVAARGGEERWELQPVIPAGETLILPDLVSGNIVMATADKSLDSSRTVRLELRTETGVLLATFTRADVSGSAATPYPYSFDLSAASVPNKTLTAGESLELWLINATADNRYDITVHQRRGTTLYADYSYLTFDTTTVISIDSRGAYSQPQASGNAQKAAYLAGEHIYLRASVSDPFGTADINAVTIAIKDPSGATVITTAAMPQLVDTDTSDGSLRYEYDFTVPTNPRLGNWTATITAKEGIEGWVEDIANIPFAVHGTITVGKTWSSDAPAGDSVVLTITGGSTTIAGSSVAGGATVPAAATSTAAAILTLAESFSTGDAGIYTVTLECTRTLDSASLPVTGTGLSRSITMPNDSSVTCTWSNSKTVPLLLVKSSSVVSDPVNLAINPKAIPGAVVEYTILVSNPSGNAIDADSVFLRDTLPVQVALIAGDLGSPGSGPVSFTGVGSGLTVSPADVAYSTDGTTWVGYVPIAGGDGTDPLVKAIRVNPKGVFNGGGAQFTLKFRVRIK